MGALGAKNLSPLLANTERFHAEKAALLVTGLKVSRAVTVDDTGTRHQGLSGTVTHIGNELFAWFQSSRSKSRINFLELLRAGHTDYWINEEALAPPRLHGAPAAGESAPGAAGAA